MLLSSALLLVSYQTMHNVAWNRSVRARHVSAAAASWPPTEQLEAILAMSHNNNNATNNNKRLVVAAANYGYVDFADNFAHQLLTHLKVTNLVLVPLDHEAHQLLSKAYPEHTLPVMPDSLLQREGGGDAPPPPPPPPPPPTTSSLLRRMYRWIANDCGLVQRLWWWVLWLTPGREARDAYAPTFNSRGFRELTSTRPVFLRAFLEAGYSVLYSDIDTVWQRNLWEYVDEEEERQTRSRSNDTATATKAVVWKDGPSHLCTCLMYLPAPPASNHDSSRGTALTLLDHWIAAIRTGTFANDQPAFNAVWKSATGLGTPVRVVPNSDAFPTGAMFFDGVNADDLADLDKNKNSNANNEASETRRNKAVVIHNNFIKGRRNKLARFRAYDLWHPSGKL